MTCHYTIKVPNWVEEYSVTLIVFGVLFAIGGGIGYYYYRQYLQRVWMRKKAEKRLAENHLKVPLEILVVAAVEVAAALLVAVVPKAVEG